MVDNASVGSIIGKGGLTIRRLTSESGALIQVQGRDDAASNRERRVAVTSVSAQNLVVWIICRRLLI